MYFDKVIKLIGNGLEVGTYLCNLKLVIGIQQII